MSNSSATASTLFPCLRACLQNIALVGCSLAIFACSPFWTNIYDETFEIDPNADEYQALVEGCFADDLSCEDLCFEVLLQNKVYSLDDLDEPEIIECRIATPAATHVRIRYEMASEDLF